ncbi:hypothetical protein ZWY2020_041177 [Hordeum vulgare]|nr:hypothetical protein ZWY2020_041177 [Hordeum vulgare]
MKRQQAAREEAAAQWRKSSGACEPWTHPSSPLFLLQPAPAFPLSTSSRTMVEGGDNGLQKLGRTYLTWTIEMDIALLEVLVQHDNNGDHAQNGWKSHVYVPVITNHYEAISKMFSQSGFGWDWVNNKLSIDSEDVWTKYVAANNKITFYKNKVIKNWDAITNLKDHANGEGVITGGETIVEPTAGPTEESPAKKTANA